MDRRAASHHTDNLMRDVISILDETPTGLEQPTGEGQRKAEINKRPGKSPLMKEGRIGELQQCLISLFEKSEGCISSNNRGQAAAASVRPNNE